MYIPTTVQISTYIQIELWKDKQLKAQFAYPTSWSINKASKSCTGRQTFGTYQKFTRGNKFYKRTVELDFVCVFQYVVLGSFKITSFSKYVSFQHSLCRHCGIYCDIVDVFRTGTRQNAQRFVRPIR